MATKTTKKTAPTTAPDGEVISMSEAAKQTSAYKASDLATKGSAVVVLVHGYKFSPKSREGSGMEWCKTTGFHKSVYDLADEIAAELKATYEG